MRHDFQLSSTDADSRTVKPSSLLILVSRECKSVFWWEKVVGGRFILNMRANDSLMPEPNCSISLLVRSDDFCMCCSKLLATGSVQQDRITGYTVLAVFQHCCRKRPLSLLRANKRSVYCKAIGRHPQWEEPCRLERSGNIWAVNACENTLAGSCHQMRIQTGGTKQAADLGQVSHVSFAAYVRNKTGNRHKPIPLLESPSFAPVPTYRIASV